MPLVQPARLVRQLLLSLAMIAPCAALAAPSAIYLVRHGEKTSNTERDPELSSQGKLRAQNIAAMLGHADIKSVFATPTIRTRSTAAPLAEQLALPIQEYAPRAPQELVNKVSTLEGAVLIVGHSNTLPELVTLFGGQPGSEIDEEREFDRVYQLITGPDGKVSTIRLTSLPATPL